MPRIATIVIIDDENIGNFCMINIHLDYQVPSIQLRQLKSVLNLIEIYSKNYKVILTGDFNMEISDEKFKNFINEIEKNNIKHVKIDGYSWYDKEGNGKMLDHIFIPEKWQIEDAYIDNCKDVATTSDHRPVVAKVKIK